MALGSLALWVAIPIAWLWLVRDLEPAGTRFLVTIIGCVLTMGAAGWGLYRLQDVYARTAGVADGEPEQPRWLRSSAGSRLAGAPLSLLDRMLVGSAMIAVVALVVWWALFSDSSNPSGPLQPL
jgi:hypothetical protein